MANIYALARAKGNKNDATTTTSLFVYPSLISWRWYINTVTDRGRMTTTRTTISLLVIGLFIKALPMKFLLRQIPFRLRRRFPFIARIWPFGIILQGHTHNTTADRSTTKHNRHTPRSLSELLHARHGMLSSIKAGKELLNFYVMDTQPAKESSRV